MNPQNKIALVTRAMRASIEKKYQILDMKLFGSSARGDFSKSSDIDIMVKLPHVNRRIEEDLFDLAYDLELEYDCLIDMIVVGQDEQNIPLYENIAKEGISI